MRSYENDAEYNDDGKIRADLNTGYAVSCAPAVYLPYIVNSARKCATAKDYLGGMLVARIPKWATL